MKALVIIALVLSLAGAGVAAYHVVETYPNVKSSEARAERGRIDSSLWMSYREAGWNQIYAMWGLAGLGLLLSLVGAAKNTGKGRLIGLVVGAVALGTLVVSLTTMMSGRIG